MNDELRNDAGIMNDGLFIVNYQLSIINCQLNKLCCLQ